MLCDHSVEKSSRIVVFRIVLSKGLFNSEKEKRKEKSIEVSHWLQLYFATYYRTISFSLIFVTMGYFGISRLLYFKIV